MNNKKILVNSSNTEIIQETIRVSYNITICAENSIKTDILYYDLDKKYEPFVCFEIADPVIVQVLPFAMRGGYDIISNLPITEKLYYQIKFQLIPQICICHKELYHPIIDAPVNHFNWNPQKVATALSLGVDSFSTLFEYTDVAIPESYRLNCLTYYENGAHHMDGKGSREQRKELFEGQCAKVQKFCNEFNYELIIIRSNLYTFLIDNFWYDLYQKTHTYRNIGFTLLLQKLIRVYYYAPAYNSDEFLVDLDDPSRYEKLLLPCLSTDFTTFYNSNGSKNRFEKIEFISKYPETYRYLTVCYNSTENCGKCYKCKYTQLELDAIEKLDFYKDSFNIPEYKKMRDNYILWAYKHGVNISHPVIDYMEKKGYKLPIWMCVKLAFFRIKKSVKVFINKTVKIHF